MRHVSDCHVHRRGDFVIIDITANAFLHHMVRNIAGSLLAVGTHSRSVDWFQAVLLSRDRTQAAETAPPEGSISLGSTIRRFLAYRIRQKADNADWASLNALKLLN